MRRGLRSLTIRIKSREEIISVSRLKACTEAVDATPDSPRCHGRPRVPPRPSRSRFQTHWFLHLPLLRCRQATVQEPFSGRRPVFCTPWTGGTIPVSTAAVPTPSAVTASEIGPLTSPPAGRRQTLGETCGDLATPLSWVYCITLVQSLYISCYVSLNKQVLSYLLLRLLPPGLALVLAPLKLALYYVSANW